MAQFPAEIQLTVDNSQAIRQIAAVEKSLNKIKNIRLTPFERNQAAKAEAEINKQLDVQAVKYAAIERVQRQLLANDNSRIKANEKLNKTQQFIQDKISQGRLKRRSRELIAQEELEGRMRGQYATAIGPQPDRTKAIRQAQQVAAAEARLNKTRTEAIGRQAQFAKLQRVENKAKLEAARDTAQATGELKDFERALTKFTSNLSTTTKALKKDFKGTGGAGRGGGRNRLSSALVGGAFPALFGGGPGAIAGGFIGELFGPLGGVVGSALGAPVDEFVQTLTKLADSVDSATDILDGLAAAGIRVSKELKSTVQTLEDQGRFLQAYQVALGELERRFGPNAVQQLSNYDAANESVQEELSKLSASLQRELLPALTLVTQGVAGLLSLIEQSGGILKFLANLVPGGRSATAAADIAGAAGVPGVNDVLRRVTESPTNAFGFQDNKGPAAAAAKEAEAAQKRSADLVRQINQNQEKINAAKRAAAREESTHQKEMLRLTYERTRIEIDTMKKRIALQSQLIINANKLKILQAEGRIAELSAQKEMAQAAISLLENGKQPSLIDTDLEKTLNLLQQIELEEINDKAGLLGQKLSLAGMSMEEINKFTAIYKKTLSEAVIEADRLEEINRKLRDLDRRQDSIRSENSQRQQLAGSADALQRAELQFANPFGGDTYETEIQKLDQISELRAILNEQQEKGLQLTRERLGAKTPEEAERIDEKIRNQERVNKQIRDEALARQEVERAILQQQQVLEKLQPITDGLAAGITDFFTAVINGSKSAEEAFSDMLKNMGQALIQQAAIMIAQYIAIGIAKAFAGMSGGNSPTPQFDLFNSAPPGFNNIGPMTRFEGGGYTGMAPRAGGLDGRGGFMAMVHPDETIIDHRAPMSRYNGGNSPSNGGAMTINFQTQMINNVEYVTKDEAMAMSKAAANDGARRGAQSGHARSMQTLQNSRSQRAKLGMS